MTRTPDDSGAAAVSSRASPVEPDAKIRWLRGQVVLGDEGVNEGVEPGDMGVEIVAVKVLGQPATDQPYRR